MDCRLKPFPGFRFGPGIPYLGYFPDENVVAFQPRDGAPVRLATADGIQALVDAALAAKITELNQLITQAQELISNLSLNIGFYPATSYSDAQAKATGNKLLLITSPPEGMFTSVRLFAYWPLSPNTLNFVTTIPVQP